MRCAVLFTSLLLLSIVPLSTNAIAEVVDSEDGIVLSVENDQTNETTTLSISVPENLTLSLEKFESLRTTNIFVYRYTIPQNQYQFPSNANLTYHLIDNLTLCGLELLISECLGNTIETEYNMLIGSYYVGYYLSTAETPASTRLVLLSGNDTDPNWAEWDNTVVSHRPFYYWGPSGMLMLYGETGSEIAAVENLSANYSDGVTDLTWNYPTGLDMNHSIMIYSHDSPATRENWNEMSKTIISSSIPAGTTSYQIDHSGKSVEREIYYSVTLLYPTSEDTRFLGSNTLTSPVWEDNVAPLFIGELSATFDPETSITTIYWGQGVDDDDLVINIYRNGIDVEEIDSSTLIATVSADQSLYEYQIPSEVHRQSWYSISLQDSAGNEVLELSEASPVAGPVIETTLESTSVTNLNFERYGDGTLVLTWDDLTNNQDAMARIWRSFDGPITTLQNVEEIESVDLSSGQASHNPLNPQDEAWYAVTIYAAWGTEDNTWHDDTLILGVNSMQDPVRETEEEIEAMEINFQSQVLTTSGIKVNIFDGAMISLGKLNQNDIIVITTSYAVENISCFDVDGQGASLHAESDWSLSFDANHSGEKCEGMIFDGDEEITFQISWNYEEITTIDAHQDEGDETAIEEKADKKTDSTNVVSITILTIIILALFVYLLVMMRTPEYVEEEE